MLIGGVILLVIVVSGAGALLELEYLCRRETEGKR